MKRYSLLVVVLVVAVLSWLAWEIFWKPRVVHYVDAPGGFSLDLPVSVVREPGEAGGRVTFGEFTVPKGTSLVARKLVMVHGRYDLLEHPPKSTEAAATGHRTSTFEIRAVMDDYQEALRKIKAQPDKAVIDSGYEVVPSVGYGTSKAGAKGGQEKIIVSKKVEITGDKIAGAEAKAAHGFEIKVDFNEEGTKQFAELTRKMALAITKEGKHPLMAILKDGVVISSSSLTLETAKRGGISEGSMVISGSFSEAEADEVARDLSGCGAETPRTMTIGGETFSRRTVFEAKGGQIVMHLIFSWKQGDEAVHFDFQHFAQDLRTVNPQQGPEEYNESKEAQLAEQVMGTFREGRACFVWPVRDDGRRNL